MTHKVPNTYNVAFAGICGSDLQKTSRTSRLRELQMLGHEIVVRDDKGYAVINPMISCKTCKSCLEHGDMFCENLEAIGRASGGAFSGTITAPETNLVNISYAEPKLGVLVDPLGVVLHGMEKLDNPQDILIIGDGTIAQLSLLYLCLPGSSLNSCTLIAKSPERAKSLRAQYSKILKDQVDKIFILESVADGSTYDAVIECVGRGQSETINLAISHVATKGTILSFGIYPIGFKADLDIRPLLYKEATIIGSNSYNHADFINATTIIGEYESAYASLLGDTYSDITKAFQAARSKKVPEKIIVSFKKSL